tara:strand:- start:1303 stop:2073 length:771 start_codon:yes stop_codon:yes gene_type:complete
MDQTFGSMIQNTHNECTTLACYDPDLPVQFKTTFELIKEFKQRDRCNICNSSLEKCLLVCENGCVCCKDCEPDYFTKGSRRTKNCRQCNGKALDFPINNPLLDAMVTNVRNIDVEMTVGLQQIKNHGYITEGMENGGIAPDWVPISRKQAYKEVMKQFTSSNDNKEKDAKKNTIDKRKREAYTEEEWKNIQQKRLKSFKEKQQEKKNKIEDYDRLLSTVKDNEKILNEKNDYIRLLEEKISKLEKPSQTNLLDLLD